MKKKMVKTKNRWNKWKTSSRVIHLSLAISIITLSIKSPTSPCYKSPENFQLDKKQDLTICYLQETYFTCKRKQFKNKKDGKRYNMLMLIKRKLEWLH